MTHLTLSFQILFSFAIIWADKMLSWGKALTSEAWHPELVPQDQSKGGRREVIIALPSSFCVRTLAHTPTPYTHIMHTYDSKK